MIFNLISAMPEACLGAFNHGVVGRAFSKGLFAVNKVNPRQFAKGVHQTIDDKPFGGGEGMLSLAEPFAMAIESLDSVGELCILSPQGEPWRDHTACEFSKKKAITLVCPRYSGMDHRLLLEFPLREISVGDYILSGGELAAGIVIDSVARYIPGVLGDPLSPVQDSFGEGCGLEAPAYSRPRQWRGHCVPDVFLSGHHQKISEYSEVFSFWRTLQKRPEILSEPFCSVKPPSKKLVNRVFHDLSDADLSALGLSKELIHIWNKEWKWW